MNTSQVSHRVAQSNDQAAGPATAPPPGHHEEDGPPHSKRTAGQTVRRLLPQALVLAILAGGVSVFMAHDKTVELSVDGESTSLRTFASSVSELLEDEGVEVGPRDMVAPAADEPLADGDRVAVRFGRPMTLTLDGREQRVWTTERTVDGALRQLGVRAQGSYLSVSRSRPIGRDGVKLAVRTARDVAFLADGALRRVRTRSATVSGALADAGLTLRGEDTVSVPLDAFPRDGQTISVRRVRTDRKVTEHVIPHSTVRKPTAELPQGTEVVEQQGRDGVRRITYEQRTVDGERQKPRQVEERTVSPPRERIVRVGTGPSKKPPPQAAHSPKPSPTPGSSGTTQGTGSLNWEALAQCESGGRPDVVDPSGTYGGLYQFDVSTWQSVGGKGLPQDASPQEQTMRAQKLYDQRGASPWPVCGRKLHQ